MTIESLDHFTIVTGVLYQSVNFYCDVIGLRNGDQPPFKVPGAWLYFGDATVLHLIASNNEHVNTSRLDHAALKAKGYEEMLGRLADFGSNYEETNLPSADVRQDFVTTPESEKLELIFDLAEVPENRRAAGR